MKNLIAAALALGAFVAFAFQSPGKQANNNNVQDELPLVISLEGIEDGEAANINSEVFLAETE